MVWKVGFSTVNVWRLDGGEGKGEGEGEGD